MSKELPFVVLCMEKYKNAKEMSGKEIVGLFKKYLVFEYMKTFMKRFTRQERNIS